MKKLIVAKHKIKLGVALVLVLVAINVVGPFLPEGYGVYLRAVWWAWIGAAGWLAWSVVGTLIFSTETVELAPEVQKSFDQFEHSLQQLTEEQQDLAGRLRDAVTFQRELVNVVIGFIEQAESIQHRQAAIASGNVGEAMFADAPMGQLLSKLDSGQRQDALDTETGILRAQETAYRRQAQLLLDRVMQARAQIAQQRLKLNQSEAAVPMLQMGRALGVCESRLTYLNETMQPGRLAAGVSNVKRLLN